MLNTSLSLPSRYGQDLSDPDVLESVLAARDSALMQFAQDVTRLANDPRYIVVNGQPLQKQAEADAQPRGTLRIYHGSWANALKMRGWKICDGTGGTPQIHPSPNDTSTLSRYMLASAWGSDSGTTSGAATHSHAFTQPSAHASPSVDAHALDFSTLVNAHNASDICSHSLAHTHDFTNCCTSEPSATTTACCGAAEVASSTHTHTVSGTTDQKLGDSEGCHTGTLAHSGSTNLSHSVTFTGSHSGGAVTAASASVPSVTVIVLMKL